MPNRKSEDEIVTGSAAPPPAELNIFQKLSLQPSQPPGPDSRTMQSLLHEVSRRPKSQPRTASQLIALGRREPAYPGGYTPPTHHAQLNQTSIQSQWGESSAAEALEAEKAASQKKDAELARLHAQVTQLREENGQICREKNEAVSARQADENELIRIKEKLKLHMLEIEFLNSKNPLSPPEIREMFECWRSLTKDNKRAPVKGTGKGMKALCGEWFEDKKENVDANKLSRFVTALNQADRKKGGAVARP